MHTTINEILESYIKGKDEDQYPILEHIYSENAELEFEIGSDEISFPNNVFGNLEIARVLSRDFNKNYAEVKTYYLSKPSVNQLNFYEQNWLVVMKDISSGFTRVGTGYYNWHLYKNQEWLQILKHKIYIHSMIQLQDHASTELKRIQNELSYPWTTKEEVTKALRSNSKFKEILEFLQ